MNLRLLFLLILSFSVSSNAQEKKEKIEWKEGQVLSWSDFKAEADESSDYAANTNSGISYSWNYSTASGQPVLTHKVSTNFYPNLSWVKEDEKDAYLLAHEQLHFDISELHARKLRKAIQEYEIGRTIRLDLKRIYNRVEAERVTMQNRFDRKTSHSQIKEAEMNWRKFIASELQKFEAYSN